MGITRTLLLYRLVQYLGFPIIVLYFAFRLVTQAEYRPYFGERLGFLPRSFRRTEAGAIWLHAVSVGEVASARPLLHALREKLPNAPIYLSTSTAAGRKMAGQLPGHLVDGIFYAPLDFVACVRRTIRLLKPSLVVIIETEIWPNLFAEVKDSGAVLVLVNARISDRTWPTYERARAFFRPLLALPDLVLVQTETDRVRYLRMGVDSEKLAIAGNLKYDAATPAAGSVDLPTWNTKHVWIAASTVGPNDRGSLEHHAVDEDDLVLDAFQKLQAEFPRLLLILAPRQPARFDTVANKLTAAGVAFIRRTELRRDPWREVQVPGVLLLDTIGELSHIYADAQVVFVGGSIAPRGGHNILEPAAAARAIVVGPHMQNFAAIALDFLSAAALVQIKIPGDLAEAVGELLRNPELATRLGDKAYTLVRRHQGASQRIAADLSALYFPSLATKPRNLIAKFILNALAFVWTEGGVVKRLRGEAIARSRPPLTVSVISIGGITMGGSGKTPFCDYLAGALCARGGTPAILTRGYRRRSPARTIILPPGAVVSTALTGDEAQIFLRSGHAVVAIGSDRFESAQTALEFAPSIDTFLLDDGFQHAPMPRDFDVVLIDGLDPFGGGDVVPRGRLREPLNALQRADAFVVTRADETNRFHLIRDALQRYNSMAPVFSAQLQTREWHGMISGRVLSLAPGRRVAAFCALGNPQNFWNTLARLDLNIAFRWTFDDHHQYRPTEIQRLAHQARAHGIDLLVTTEKDAINLPANVEALLHGIEVAWLRVELLLTDPESFFSHLDHALARRA